MQQLTTMFVDVELNNHYLKVTFISMRNFITVKFVLYYIRINIHLVYKETIIYQYDRMNNHQFRS